LTKAEVKNKWSYTSTSCASLQDGERKYFTLLTTGCNRPLPEGNSCFADHLPNFLFFFILFLFDRHSVAQNSSLELGNIPDLNVIAMSDMLIATTAG
jgi:hypothetical protein